MSLLNSNFNIEEPTELTNPLEKLIRVGFGVDRDAEPEEIEVELDEPVEEAENAEDASSEPEEIRSAEVSDEL